MTWLRRTPLAAARWVVLDCETTGLDPKRDRLLSVAAVEVARERITAQRSYAAVLRQEGPSSPDNILIHGIGAEAQLGGRYANEVLQELALLMHEGFAAAFHATFDREVLARAFRAASARPAKVRWLDLATLAPVLFPGRRSATNLDGWLAEFSIECPARHDALADAYATAQLLLVLLAEARRQKIANAEALIRVASSAAWIPGSR